MRIAFQRNVQLLRRFFDLRAVAQENRHAQAQRIKLARRLQHARLRAFRKNNPLRMPLQFFDDTANKSHGAKLAAIRESANSSRWARNRSPPRRQERGNYAASL